MVRLGEDQIKGFKRSLTPQFFYRIKRVAWWVSGMAYFVLEWNISLISIQSSYAQENEEGTRAFTVRPSTMRKSDTIAELGL